MLIKKVVAREILDSRGMPTVEVELETNVGFFSAQVPSGTSTGTNEAFELRDKEKRYGGNGVLKAIENVMKKIAPKIHYLSPENQKMIDELLIKLDGTVNKSRLGANAILAVSVAVCKAGAAENELPLYEYIAQLYGKKMNKRIPVPLILIFEGGKHAHKSSDIQEFMIIPTEEEFKEGLRKGVEVYHMIGELMKKNNFSTTVGYEGAYGSPFKNDTTIFEFVQKGILSAGFKEKEFRFAIDVAASELYDKNSYSINGKHLKKKTLLSYYQTLIKNYDIASIEDGFDEDDWDSWKGLTSKIGKSHMIVGDDLLTSNPTRIRRAIKEKACNTLLLKINQIGTISEALEAARLASDAGWKIIVSHRSGETEDTFIVDFAVGIGADFVKFGAPSRGERTGKYNQLLRIGEALKTA